MSEDDTQDHGACDECGKKFTEEQFDLLCDECRARDDELFMKAANELDNFMDKFGYDRNNL